MVHGSRFEIKVKNLNKKHRISEKFVEKIAKDILKFLGKKRVTILDIVFLSDTAIRPLNRRYRYSDRATDVLSFDLGNCGQILISSDTALRNSRIFKTSFEEEIVLYVIHGILHLSGYVDETGPEKNRMSKKENLILKKLCRERFSKVLTQQ